MDQPTAAALAAKPGWTITADAGRGWRRVVPSPRPRVIFDLDAIRDLVQLGYVVTGVVGGGIPVVRGPDGRLHGVEAVIDKDFASALLAEASAPTGASSRPRSIGSASTTPSPRGASGGPGHDGRDAPRGGANAPRPWLPLVRTCSPPRAYDGTMMRWILLVTIVAGCAKKPPATSRFNCYPASWSAMRAGTGIDCHEGDYYRTCRGKPLTSDERACSVSLDRACRSGDAHACGSFDGLLAAVLDLETGAPDADEIQARERYQPRFKQLFDQALRRCIAAETAETSCGEPLGAPQATTEFRIAAIMERAPACNAKRPFACEEAQYLRQFMTADELCNAGDTVSCEAIQTAITTFRPHASACSPAAPAECAEAARLANIARLDYFTKFPELVRYQLGQGAKLGFLESYTETLEQLNPPQLADYLGIACAFNGGGKADRICDTACRGGNGIGCARSCAEDNGGTPSCHRLGRMLRDGTGGLQRDDELAAAYFELACSNGDLAPEACQDVADLTARSQPLGAQIGLYERACDRGNSGACATRDALVKQKQAIDHPPTPSAALPATSDEIDRLPACSSVNIVVGKACNGCCCGADAYGQCVKEVKTGHEHYTWYCRNADRSVQANVSDYDTYACPHEAQIQATRARQETEILTRELERRAETARRRLQELREQPPACPAGDYCCATNAVCRIAGCVRPAC